VLPQLDSKSTLKLKSSLVVPSQVMAQNKKESQQHLSYILYPQVDLSQLELTSRAMTFEVLA
jgi:hypothetical protein